MPFSCSDSCRRPAIRCSTPPWPGCGARWSSRATALAVYRIREHRRRRGVLARHRAEMSATWRAAGRPVRYPGRGSPRVLHTGHRRRRYLGWVAELDDRREASSQARASSCGSSCPDPTSPASRLVRGPQDWSSTVYTSGVAARGVAHALMRELLALVPGARDRSAFCTRRARAGRLQKLGLPDEQRCGRRKPMRLRAPGCRTSTRGSTRGLRRARARDAVEPGPRRRAVHRCDDFHPAPQVRGRQSRSDVYSGARSWRSGRCARARGTGQHAHHADRSESPGISGCEDGTTRSRLRPRRAGRLLACINYRSSLPPSARASGWHSARADGAAPRRVVRAPLPPREPGGQILQYHRALRVQPSLSRCPIP